MATLFSLLAFVGCANAAKKDDPRPRVIIMTYNVENLFDWEDDPAVLDETYLPKEMKLDARIKERCKLMTNDKYRSECLNLDWSEKVVNMKMGRLAHVIGKVNGDAGPDILIMPEVENIKVLKLFNEKYLKSMNFTTAVLLEGDDERGIDVGLLSKFPLAGMPQIHTVDITNLDYIDRDGKVNGKGKPTRGILEVPLKLPNGEQLTVFGVHFPSPANPQSFRLKALEVLDKVTKANRDKENVIVAGDFNISSEEDLTAGLYSNVLGKDWGVSHRIGCKGCEGSHVFMDKWSFLDAILLSKPIMDSAPGGWRVDKDSIRLITNSLYQSGRFKGSPKFDEGSRATGVSDHYPMVAELVLTSKAAEKVSEKQEQTAPVEKAK